MDQAVQDKKPRRSKSKKHKKKRRSKSDTNIATANTDEKLPSIDPVPGVDDTATSTPAVVPHPPFTQKNPLKSRRELLRTPPVQATRPTTTTTTPFPNETTTTTTTITTTTTGGNIETTESQKTKGEDQFSSPPPPFDTLRHNQVLHSPTSQGPSLWLIENPIVAPTKVEFDSDSEWEADAGTLEPLNP